MVSFIRESIPEANICAGNVVTEHAAETLIRAGADIDMDDRPPTKRIMKKINRFKLECSVYENPR